MRRHVEPQSTGEAVVIYALVMLVLIVGAIVVEEVSDYIHFGNPPCHQQALQAAAERLSDGR